ncbi:MAG: acyl carrier protein [Robiginitomaculum sp.]|nr:MAG: acyl carrier protein [Robiginitomaculum sp.]
MSKQTALIVCPGRGTYNAAELGYFHTHHADKAEFLHTLDEIRSAKGQARITDLDSAKAFKPSLHGTGENASLLIYACALADFMTISTDMYDIVAITGNSMGWYLALAASGALSLTDGAILVNEMGTLMHECGTGGQIVYPVVDSNWRPDPQKRALVEDMLAHGQATEGVEIHISIRLGGMVVFAANDEGLKYLSANLPQDEHFPLRLRGHNGFHSPILDHIVPLAQDKLSPSLFTTPDTPLIDGQGQIWMPHSTDVRALYDYTLGAQLNSSYDFSAAINVGIKEFAPDKIIVLGPGTTMGAPVAQVLIENHWNGLADKDMFKTSQAENPFLISMGMDTQRTLVK